MDRIKRIGREEVYQGSILTICKDTMENPDGRISYWDYIEHSGAAAVIPVLDDGRILMVRQYRNSVDRETIEIPAGGIEPGEDHKNAAIRECEEETGYRPSSCEKFLSVITAVAFCNEIIDIYICKGLQKTAQNLDPDEYIGVEAFALDELLKMIEDGKIQDSKTVSAISSYALRCR